MPKILKLVPIGRRIGVVLDVPTDDYGCVTIYTAKELADVLAAEREACAVAAEMIADQIIAPTHGAWDRGYAAGRKDAGAAIRARSTLSE